MWNGPFHTRKGEGSALVGRGGPCYFLGGGGGVDPPFCWVSLWVPPRVPFWVPPRSSTFGLRPSPGLYWTFRVREVFKDSHSPYAQDTHTSRTHRHVTRTIHQELSLKQEQTRQITKGRVRDLSPGGSESAGSQRPLSGKRQQFPPLREPRSLERSASCASGPPRRMERESTEERGGILAPTPKSVNGQGEKTHPWTRTEVAIVASLALSGPLCHPVWGSLSCVALSRFPSQIDGRGKHDITPRWASPTQVRPHHNQVSPPSPR